MAWLRLDVGRERSLALQDHLNSCAEFKILPRTNDLFPQAMDVFQRMFSKLMTFLFLPKGARGKVKGVLLQREKSVLILQVHSKSEGETRKWNFSKR